MNSIIFRIIVGHPVDILSPGPCFPISSARTEINYVPEKTSWLVNAISAHAACAVDAEGIVEIVCRDTAAAA